MKLCNCSLSWNYVYFWSVAQPSVLAPYFISGLESIMYRHSIRGGLAIVGICFLARRDTGGARDGSV